jgi:PAS domain S-box-containing protein
MVGGAYATDTRSMVLTRERVSSPTERSTGEHVVAVIVADANLQVRAVHAGEGLAERIGWDPRALCERSLAGPDVRTAWPELVPACISALAGDREAFERTAGDRRHRVEVDPVHDRGGDVAKVVITVIERPALGTPAIAGAAFPAGLPRRAPMPVDDGTSLFWRGFAQAPTAMAIVDPVAGRFVRVNDALCALTGHAREVLLAGTIDDVSHPDDRGVVRTLRRGPDGVPDAGHRYTKRYVRPDGSTVSVEVHLIPVCPAGSTPTCLAHVVPVHPARPTTEAEDQDALWLGRLRDALDEDRLVLYSQPIVDLVTGRTVQNELLLRMLDRDGRIVSPGLFLPAAERSGLISEVDRWVIRQAVAAAAEGTAVQFNVSGRSLSDPTVMAQLEESVAAAGVDPELLVVEVTETAMMDSLGAAREFARRVTEVGCPIALDDFGTGFGGLTYLKHLPVQHLKIDMEFVRETTLSARGEQMVRAIVGLAKEFGLTTTAEGVEEPETGVRLAELGVDRAQGYRYGRPQPVT